MRVLTILPLVLALYSCGSQAGKENKNTPQTPIAKTDSTTFFRVVHDSSVDSISPIPHQKDIDSLSIDYKTKAYLRLHGDSLRRVNYLSRLLNDIIEEYPDSTLKVYRKIAPYWNLKRQEYLLSHSINHNNIGLFKAVFNYLNRNGSYNFSSEFRQRWTNRWEYKWEQVDTSLISFALNNIGPFASNSNDSAFVIIKSLQDTSLVLFNYYLTHGWVNQINSLCYFDESGDAPYDGYTPFDIALGYDNEKIIYQLINLGAKYSEKTFIMHASGKSADIIFNLLVKQGSDPQALLDSALAHAVFEGQQNMVSKLIEMGANIDSKHGPNKQPVLFYTMSQYGFPVEDPTLRKLQILDLLLVHGALVNNQNKNGITPLMYSSIPWSSDGTNYKLGFAKVLLNHGASPNLKDKSGRSFWDHIIENKNKIFMDYFKNQVIMPDSYKSKFDTISKTIELDMKWVYPIVELDSAVSNESK